MRRLTAMAAAVFAAGIAHADFTSDLNREIAEVSAKGGGRVNVAAGRHEVGTIVLKDGVELHLEEGAEIVGSAAEKDYPLVKTFRTESQKDVNGWSALVYAEGAKNIAITGRGTIDGNGAVQKGRVGLQGECDLDGRPRGLLFVSCSGVKVSGITLKHAGMWTQHYFDCEDVTVEGMKVFSRANHNNDGIDIDSCRRVTVRDCDFDSSDDAVVIKTTSVKPCEDVTVENCRLSSLAGGFKIGTETLGDVRRIRAKGLKIFRSPIEGFWGWDRREGSGEAGIEVISTDGALVEDVRVEDVEISDEQVAFFIRVGDRCRPIRKGGFSRPAGSIRGVRLANIRGVNLGNLGSSIVSYEDGRITDVELENISLRIRGGIGEGDYRSLASFRTWSNTYPTPGTLGTLPAKGVFFYGATGVKVKNLGCDSEKPDVRPVSAEKRAEKRTDVEYIAHQGEEYLAHNHTVEAYRMAAEHGLEYIKLDIRETKDGVIVLQHDKDLRAMYATNIVIREETYDNIKRYCRPRGGCPGSICTLDEALPIAKTLKGGAWIDFKDYSPDLVDRVMKKVVDSGLGLDRIMVVNHSKTPLLYVREHYPSVRCVPHVHISYDEKTDTYRCRQAGEKKTFKSKFKVASALAWEAYQNGWYGYNMPTSHLPDRTNTDEEMIRVLHDSGYWVAIWFVNCPADGDYYRKAGADAFVTMCAAATGRREGTHGYEFALPKRGIGGDGGNVEQFPANTPGALRDALRRGCHLTLVDCPENVAELGPLLDVLPSEAFLIGVRAGADRAETVKRLAAEKGRSHQVFIASRERTPGSRYLLIDSIWPKEQVDAAHAEGLKLILEGEATRDPACVRKAMAKNGIDYIVSPRPLELLGMYWGLQKSHRLITH